MTNKPKYNTMCDIGFIIVHEYADPSSIPPEELIKACEARLAELKKPERRQDALEAFGILDTYRVSDE